MKHQSGQVSLHLILTIFLGLGMVLFGVLAVVAYENSSTINATLDQRTQAAAAAASIQQKAADAEASSKADEQPFRTYTASAVDGGFTFQIPKDWSIYAQHNQSSSATQLDLIANPDVIDYTPGGINTQAFELQLVTTSLIDVVKTYDARVKAKQLTSSGVTVSGIQATKLTGSLDTQRHTGTVIVFPVRDKTMILTSQTPNYSDEFNTIVASAHIVP